jgi:hypothetical protein
MGRGEKKVTDNVLIDSYASLGNVWKVAKEVDLCGQSVHERLSRLGIIRNINVFTEEEKTILLRDYIKYRDAGKLNDLAIIMGRTKQFICRKAKVLGLTDQMRPYYRTPRKKIVAPPHREYMKDHYNVRKLRGSPHFCEICGEHNKNKWYDWANLTGKYDDPRDYRRMCRTCHRNYDKQRRDTAKIHGRR